MMNESEIMIEMQRSLEGTHQYRNAGAPSRGTGSSRRFAPAAPIGAPSSVDHVKTRHGRIGGATNGNVLYPELSYAVVGALIEVHRWLGPGQLESTYQNALEKELGVRAIPFRAQAPIDAYYKEWKVGEFYADVIVDDSIVLELKAVSAVLPVHHAQLMSYLRATRCRLGMLVNFHVTAMTQGIQRIVV